MKQGIIRGIGNGQSTNIWSENWIPRESSLRPILSLVADLPSKVSELLVPATAQWNEELLRIVFLPVDVEAILQILVCTRNMEDFWAWHPDRKGLFLVSSAYNHIIKIKTQREDWLEGRSGASDKARQEKVWSLLWKFSVPSKVIFFSMEASSSLFADNGCAP